LTDPNNNRSAVRFDALGMVEASAVMGKALMGVIGQNEGDVLDETTPESSPADDPTTKLEYALFNWMENGRPNSVHSSGREQKASGNPRWEEAYGYFDGSGREVMKKMQAEPGLSPARGPDGELLRNDDGTLKLVDTSPNVRWVGTGRTVFNNKGNPVKKYE